MDGLEKIKARILEEAEGKAASILSAARDYAEERSREAEEEGERLLALARSRSAKAAEQLQTRMRSFAENEKRKINLDQRQEIIGRCLDRAVAILNEREAGARLAHYKKMVLDAGIHSGELMLSAADEELGSALQKELGSSFVLSDQTARISGGILVRHDDVVDNFSYDLFLRSERPALTALAAEKLFPADEAGA